MSAIPTDRPLHSQLFRFCVVGALGFVVDAGVVQALVAWRGWDPFVARLISYLAAATTAWWLNRRFTFGAGDGPVHREWIKYLVVNTSGGLVNYAVYAGLVLAFDTIRQVPALGVAAGSIVGLVVNFAMNRWLVFRRRGA